MNDDWSFDMPKELAQIIISELEWMVRNHVLEDFTCKQLMDIASGYWNEEVIEW